MGACLSKGQGASASLPLQQVSASEKVKNSQAPVKAPAEKLAPEPTSLLVEDANKPPAGSSSSFGVPDEGLGGSAPNGKLPDLPSYKIPSGKEAVEQPAVTLPPLTTTPQLSPFASALAPSSSSSSSNLEPIAQATSDLPNGWGPSIASIDLSCGEYSAIFPLDETAERKRVHALKRLGMNYTSSEPSLDFITKLVVNVCGMRSAVITFIDADYCHIKSSMGLPTDRRTFSRALSMCTWVLAPLNPEVLVIEDLAQDERFKKHPVVRNKPFLRFMAAAPLLDASGQRVGALTIHDFKPRKFDAEQCNVLCNFAEMTVREIQRITESSIQRSMSLSPGPENEQLLRSIDNCSDGVVLLDVRIARWPVLFSNEGWTHLTGQEPVSGSLKCFWDTFKLPGVSASKHPWQIYHAAIEKGETFQLDVIIAGSSGKHLFPITFKPATETLDDGMVNINVPAQAATTVPTSRTHKLFYFGTILRQSRESASSGGSGPRGSLPQPDDDLKPPIPGVRLGPLLGKGSFGSVHYGTWNGAQIAVKVIQHMATEAEKQARDEQLEAILGLKMLHPNIVRTFQFATKDRSQQRPVSLSERIKMELNEPEDDEASGTPRGQRKMMETWIVLELCNRGSLQDAIDKGAFKQRGGLNEGSPNMINILRTATEIAGAMSYLHSLDILHSDLNGNNILLISNTGIDDRPFSVKVSDFGLSRIHIGERTIATQTYGTVTHMPPELLSEGRLSKAADVYAFGVLLWEMLTGQRPWSGLRHVQIITHKMRTGSQLKWPSDTFSDYKRLATHCMTPDPHNRPTFAEVLDILEPMRELAERGELQKAAPYVAPERAALGDQLRIVPEEEEDSVIGSK